MPEPNDASKQRVEPGSAESDSNDQSRRRAKNVAAEPAPDLSEQGGIEPVERAPSKYHDRTRDRTLEES